MIRVSTYMLLYFNALPAPSLPGLAGIHRERLHPPSGIFDQQLTPDLLFLSTLRHWDSQKSIILDSDLAEPYVFSLRAYVPPQVHQPWQPQYHTLQLAPSYYNNITTKLPPLLHLPTPQNMTLPTQVQTHHMSVFLL